MPTQNAICIIAIWIVIVLLSSLWCTNYLPKQEELSRKIIHIGTGPVILLAWLFDLPKNIAVSAAALITIALGLNYKFRLLPDIEDIKRGQV